MKQHQQSCFSHRLVLFVIIIMSYRTAMASHLLDELSNLKHPFLACSAQELARLQKAYRGTGPAKRVATLRVKQADPFINDPNPIVFPPRGGQHNQWYQCQQCELGLKTMDDTHHKCPKCGRIYSGHPYDDVIFSGQHRANLFHMHTAAWAYAISGQKKYAERAAKVLLGYADRYTKYPYHSASMEIKSSWGSRAGGHLFEQTLTEAASLASLIAPAYDLIHDSPALSEADHEKIRRGLLLPMLRNIDRNKAGKSNWQSWHNAAMLWGGALLGDHAWVRKALDDPKNGFHYQMKTSVSGDGMWYENSWGYHFYTLKALVITAEGARRLGIDIWQDDNFRKMFTLPIQYTMVRGRLPRFGDDVNSSLRAGSSFWEAPYHTYRDPSMQPLLSEKPNIESIMLGRSMQRSHSPSTLKSSVFTGAGHAIMRTNGRGALTAAMTFGPYGGFHGHYDKLSFVFYGYGKELAVDPGRAASQAYRLPIHTKWYKATVGHNTVLVDSKSQKPATGKLELFASNPQCAAVAASCDSAYPGVKHKRLLVIMKDYLLVLDELHADRRRQFDWVYHNRASGIQTGITTRKFDLPETFPAAEYIHHTKAATTNSTIRLRFEDPDVADCLTMDGQSGTKVIIGDGVGSSVTDRVPMTIIRRSGGDVFFVAILEPVPSGAKARVTDVSLKKSAGLTVMVKRGIAIDVVTLMPENRVTVTSAGKEILKGG